jgi:hypothetical protein
MAVVINRQTIGVTTTGTAVAVPSHPKARLMYYLDSMCTVLSLDQTQHNIKRLTDYFYYYLLSEEETAALLELSILLDPITLNGVCIFNDEEACGDFTNEFFEINARRTTIAAAESVMIGNIRVSVKKIMCYKMSWLEKNYLQPLSHFIKLYQKTPRRRSTAQDILESCCCSCKIL